MMLPLIGGALHGQHAMVPVGQNSLAFVKIDLPGALARWVPEDQARLIKTEAFRYVVSKISFPEGVVRFLRPEAWTDFDVLYLLVYGEQRVPEGGVVDANGRGSGRRLLPKRSDG